MTIVASIGAVVMTIIVVMALWLLLLAIGIIIIIRKIRLLGLCDYVVYVEASEVLHSLLPSGGDTNRSFFLVSPAIFCRAPESRTFSGG